MKAVYEPKSTGRALVVFTDGTRASRSRLIAAVKLGRPLAPGEVVHHENGNSLDDRLSNLVVFASQGDHAAHHIKQRLSAKRDEHRFLLRLPADLWMRIQECARTNERSVNAEIVWRLRQSIEGYRR